MKRKNYIFFILLIVLLVVISGCKKTVEEKIGEKITEKIIESSSGGAADVDIDKDVTTIKTEQGFTQVGSNIQWPKDKMGDLKEVKANITMFSEDIEKKIAFIMFEDFKKDEADKYLESLKDLGYKSVYEITSGDGLTYIGNNENGYQVTFSYSNDGVGSITFGESELTDISTVDSSGLYTGDDIERTDIGLNYESSTAPEEVDMTDAVPWPADFFGDIPELEGKITGLNKSTNEVDLYIEYVEKEVAIDYIEKIKEAGFVENPSESMSSDYFHYEAYNTDEDYIIFIWNSNNESTLSLVKVE